MSHQTYFEDVISYDVVDVLEGSGTLRLALVLLDQRYDQRTRVVVAVFIRVVQGHVVLWIRPIHVYEHSHTSMN